MLSHKIALELFLGRCLRCLRWRAIGIPSVAHVKPPASDCPRYGKVPSGINHATGFVFDHVRARRPARISCDTAIGFGAKTENQPTPKKLGIVFDEEGANRSSSVRGWRSGRINHGVLIVETDHRVQIAGVIRFDPTVIRGERAQRKPKQRDSQAAKKRTPAKRDHIYFPLSLHGAKTFRIGYRCAQHAVEVGGPRRPCTLPPSHPSVSTFVTPSCPL